MEINGHDRKFTVSSHLVPKVFERPQLAALSTIEIVSEADHGYEEAYHQTTGALTMISASQWVKFTFSGGDQTNDWIFILYLPFSVPF